MRFLLLISLLLLFNLTIFSKVEPVAGIEPSKTLPILYINTENFQEIDQKENYIEAEWWLETYGLDGFESIGSPDDPQKMGMKKNKHWTLLARLNSYCLYNELLAFEIGKQLDMSFTPSLQPVEVVLNNIYIGLYMLTESIRIDDNRLEIYEQPDLNNERETIDSGWLIELDNNKDDKQVLIPQPQGYNLQVTYHSPENLSEIQEAWLKNQMIGITESINKDNKLDREWEDYIDMESLAKHLIVQECLTNYDAYLGSCYLHKDIESKWCFGPLWDFSASGFVYKNKKQIIAERSNQHWITEIFKFPRFRKKIREIWNKYIFEYGDNWMIPFLNEFKNKIKEAVRQSVQVWPDCQIDAEEGFNLVSETITSAFNYLNEFYNEDCVTYNIKYEFRFLDFIEDEHDLTGLQCHPIVLINGMEYNDIEVLKDTSVELSLSKLYGYKIDRVYINNDEIAVDNNEYVSIELGNIDSDKEIIFNCSRNTDYEILLNVHELTLDINESYDFFVNPSVVDSNKEIIWISSAPNVANISESGIVTGISKGKAVIYVICGTSYDYCEVTVLDSFVDAEHIVLNVESAELNIGETVQLEATVLPEDTTDKSLTWNSSDPNIATVSDNGLVSAISAGTTIITATCGEASVECVITVLEDAGVESLLANPDTNISIYSSDGILIKKDCKGEDLKNLHKGIYIIVSGKDRYKISI